MKRLSLAVTGLFILFCLQPAYAQHGQGMGGGSGHTMGHSMGHTPSSMGKSGTAGATDHGGKSTPSQMLAKNQKLSGKLQGLLPQGMNPQDACTGFRNLGQCVAAVHVSHNLGLSFTDLKTKMVGSPATADAPAGKPVSLGQAIHQLAPTADANAEVKKADQQAKADMSGKS